MLSGVKLVDRGEAERRAREEKREERRRHKKEKKKHKKEKRSKQRGRGGDSSDGGGGGGGSSSDGGAQLAARGRRGRRDAWDDPSSGSDSDGSGDEGGPAGGGGGGGGRGRAEREDWMTKPMARPKSDAQLAAEEEERREAEEAARRRDPDAPFVSERELNPYLKNGGSGVPPEGGGQGGGAAPAPVARAAGVGDGGASWRLKALKRAQAQAASEGKKVNEIVSERWGSLAELTAGLTERRAAHGMAHLHSARDRRAADPDFEARQAERRRMREGVADEGAEEGGERGGDKAAYLSETKSTRAQMRRPDAGGSLSWRRPDSRGGGGGSQGRDERRRDRRGDDRHGRREGGERREGRRDDRPPRPRQDPLGRAADAAALKAAAAELNEFEGDGSFMERFQAGQAQQAEQAAQQRPEGERRQQQQPAEREPLRQAGRLRQEEPPVWGGRGGGDDDAPAAGAEVQSGASSSESEGERERERAAMLGQAPPERPSMAAAMAAERAALAARAAAPPPPEPRGEERQPSRPAGGGGGKGGGNLSAAALLRARLSGKAPPAAEAEQQPQQPEARGRGQQPGPGEAPAAAGASGGGGRETVVLPMVDARGRAVRGAFGREEAGAGLPDQGGRGQKRVQRYEDGQRARYFADDQDTDLQTLIKRTKHGDEGDVDRRLAAGIMRTGQRYKQADFDADAEYDHDAGLEHLDRRSGRRGAREKEEAREKQRQIRDYQRHASALEACRLCFASAARPRQLTLAIGQASYLALPARGRLVPGHCCIVPGDHVASTRQVDEQVWTEIRNFKKCLIQMAMKQGKEVIFFETATRLGDMRSHAVVEAVPVPPAAAAKAPMYFKKAVDDATSEWAQHHAKRFIDTKAKGLRGSIPPNFPYLHVEFGLGDGFVHVIDDERKFDRGLARSVLIGLLGLPQEDMHRRARGEAAATQQAWADEFRKEFEPYDWTRMLEA